MAGDAGWPLSREWLVALGRRDLRALWLLLLTLGVSSYLLVDSPRLMRSWGLFPRAARILFSTGPAGNFHLYHVRPDYQFGPVATLVAAPFALAPLHASKLLAAVLLTVTGLLLVAVVVALESGVVTAPRRGPLLLGGAVVMPVWVDLSIAAGHLDDVLALGFGVFGVIFVQRAQPVWAAVMFALAVDSKPWALGFVIAVLALPRSWWVRSLSVFSAVVAAAWLPFFLIEPRTLDALRFRLALTNGSLLRLVQPSGGLIPMWVRPTQLLIALVVGWFLVRAGAVQAVLLVTIAARILLDPEIAAYYTSGAALAALLADGLTGRRVPWFALSVAGLLWLPQSFFPNGSTWNAVAMALRLLWTLGTLIALLHLARMMRARRSVVVPVRPIDATA